MLITRRQIKYLIENFVLLEQKRKEFIKLVNQGLMTDADLTLVYKSNGQPRYPFNDANFRMTLFNTISKSQAHSINDFIGIYDAAKLYILDPFVGGTLQGAPIDTSAEGRARKKINSLLQDGSATYDDFFEYISFKTSRLKGSSSRLQTILDEGFAGDKTHFEVIPSDDNWIICYPKTYQGSIAVARMGPDKQYYTPPNGIGRMPWCTSINGAGNMFLNYHRAMNAHLYYFTKRPDVAHSSTSFYRKNDPTRKICVSLKKSNGKVSVLAGHASVDGNNDPITSSGGTGEVKLEPKFLNAIGMTNYNNILKDAKKSVRKEIDIKSYYESIDLVQYQAIRSAIQSKEDLELLSQEIHYYAEYAKDTRILEAMAIDPSSMIRTKIAGYSKKLDSDTIKEMLRMDAKQLQKSSFPFYALMQTSRGMEIIEEITSENFFQKSSFKNSVFKDIAHTFKSKTELQDYVLSAQELKIVENIKVYQEPTSSAILSLLPTASPEEFVPAVVKHMTLPENNLEHVFSQSDVTSGQVSLKKLFDLRLALLESVPDRAHTTTRYIDEALAGVLGAGKIVDTDEEDTLSSLYQETEIYPEDNFDVSDVKRELHEYIEEGYSNVDLGDLHYRVEDFLDAIKSQYKGNRSRWRMIKKIHDIGKRYLTTIKKAEKELVNRANAIRKPALSMISKGVDQLKHYELERSTIQLLSRIARKYRVPFEI